MIKRIGIIAAMPEEIALLDQEMLNKASVEIARRTFHTGNLFGIDSIAVVARIGKVAAAVTATTLIERWQVDAIIFVGCAGAIASQLTVGDIVVAEQLIQHDLDASPLWPKFTAPLLEMDAFPTHPQLKQLALQSSHQFLQTDFLTIDPKIRTQFNITTPRIYTGLIGSGDQFIHSAAKRRQLQQELPELLCVEMEGAAIAQVCYEYRAPFIVIRTISDQADGSADIDFSQFNAQVACHYSRGIIYHLFSSNLNNLT